MVQVYAKTKKGLELKTKPDGAESEGKEEFALGKYVLYFSRYKLGKWFFCFTFFK